MIVAEADRDVDTEKDKLCDALRDAELVADALLLWLCDIDWLVEWLSDSVRDIETLLLSDTDEVSVQVPESDSVPLVSDHEALTEKDSDSLSDKGMLNEVVLVNEVVRLTVVDADPDLVSDSDRLKLPLTLEDWEPLGL